MSQYIPIPAVAAGTWQAGVSLAANLPTSGNQQFDVRVALDDQSLYLWTGSAWVSVSGGGGGGASWGSITGTLSNQTDLQTALNGKASTGANSSITSMSGITGAIGSPTNILFTQTSTPATPGANTNRLYFKSDGNIYMLNSSGTETQVNGGGGGGIGGSTGATDNAILRADGAGGATLQNSGVTIDDTSNINFPSNTDASTGRAVFGSSGAWISNGGFVGVPGRLRLNSASSQTIEMSAGGPAFGSLTSTYAQFGLYNGSSGWDLYQQVGLTDQINGKSRFQVYTGQSGYPNAGSGETDLFTKTIHAKVLSEDGQQLNFECYGTFANNANNKTVKAYFGGTAFCTVGAAAYQNTTWVLKGALIRTGATAVKYWWEMTSSDSLIVVKTGSGTLSPTLSNNNTFKLTGQGSADNDIVQESGRIGHDAVAY